MKEAPPTDRPESPLDTICRNVLQLLAAARDTPIRLRVEADGNFVEMEWPTKAATVMLAEQAMATSDVAATASLPSGPDYNGSGGGFCIPSPSVGTFYHAPEPGAATFVHVGEELETGRQVGILEVMKLMTPVLADRPGRVVEFLVPDATPVEYGRPLIACAPLLGS
jgi:acetyl-CoA carboxylase biotin carboxyl carrier protein